jgi:hypothetical protein
MDDINAHDDAMSPEQIEEVTPARHTSTVG